MALPLFDLSQHPWLTVRASSSTAHVGLKDVLLRAHEITDVEVGLPPAAAGLWRLLVVLAARVTGLDDPGESKDEWQYRRDEVLDAGAIDPDGVAEYFERFPGRFDLFDPQRPWLQDPRLREQCSKPTGLNKLILGRPAGNNQPWVSHHRDGLHALVSSAEAPLHLIAQLYYGPSGRCTSRTVNGRSEANTTAGPLRGVLSFHLVGANLFESLIAGIPYVGDRDPKLDAAPWELDELPDPLGLPPRPQGVGGWLAGRFRHAVLLAPSDDGASVVDAWITWAWREPHPPIFDPYLVVQTNKQGTLYARQADANRALWRDLDGLLGKDIGIEHRQRPAILEQAQELPRGLRDRLRVRAYGFDQDGQTRDKQWYAATTPPVLDLLTDHGAVAGVSRTREAAERTERHLRSALRNAWVSINDPSNGNGPPARKDISVGPWPAQAANRFWPEAERLFWRRVDLRDFTDPEGDFIRLALHVYDEVTAQAAGRPRTARAVERSRGYIFKARNSTQARAS